MPNSNYASIVKEGAFDNDLAAQILGLFPQVLQNAVATVQLTNPTSATDLTTLTIPAPIPMNPGLNAAGKGLYIFAAGVYNLGAASTLVFTIKLGGVTLATFTTASQATTAVTLGWNLQLWVTTITPGSAGTVEVHGYLNFDSGATLAAAASVFNDSNTAVSSAIALNGSLLLEVMANLGSGNAGSTITERQQIVQLLP